VDRAGSGPQLDWVVPYMGSARNCVLWAGLLGTAQMYTYSLEITFSQVLKNKIPYKNGVSKVALNNSKFIFNYTCDLFISFKFNNDKSKLK
jgi:hypothetical protein